MPARRKNDNPEASAPSFEDAMAELEGIVGAMEGEQLPLEELVARYEEGSKLLKHCGTVLSAAKKRLELITLAERGEKGTDDGGASVGYPGNAPGNIPGDPDQSNDISLF